MPKGPGGFLPVEPPFGNDNLSAWERDNMLSSTANEELFQETTENQRKMVTFQPINQEDEVPMLKRAVKRQSPVDMAKLLSFGYAESDRPKSAFNERERQV